MDVGRALSWTGSRGLELLDTQKRKSEVNRPEIDAQLIRLRIEERRQGMIPSWDRGPLDGPDAEAVRVVAAD
jgi:hypothetical protein